MEIKLNLGRGSDIKKGYINLDMNDLDLNKIPYNYEDNSIDEILLSHVLEHLDKPFDVVKECHRILKPHGKLIVKLPSDNYGICHLRGRHTRGYMYAFDIRNDLNNDQCSHSFKINVKGHFRGLTVFLNNFYNIFLNLVFSEWEFDMEKIE